LYNSFANDNYIGGKFFVGGVENGKACICTFSFAVVCHAFEMCNAAKFTVWIVWVMTELVLFGFEFS
jgi:hypothetical protein